MKFQVVYIFLKLVSRDAALIELLHLILNLTLSCSVTVFLLLDQIHQGQAISVELICAKLNIVY